MNRSMVPRITEPLKNVNIEVKAGSKIDLRCSALLGSESSLEITIIYWLINGTFIGNYSSVQEGFPRVSKKGDENYLTIILHIDNAVPELYNIPITCIANSPWGADNSTLYLTPAKTGSFTWAVIIPLSLIILSLLAVFGYKHFILLTTYISHQSNKS
ncbi:interleukin-1 receptor type 2-like isoform X2 [Bufo gargarizans]|uniref:interleukin-1 receptor type 2-like isoform X2 n=1 Tax=Bufo gargarizans TaxID=30331 RepID=UPI001CF46769|nr:interleukin-1 receptor type 2-like isoform X2 [Bufo gargarizans]